MKHPGSDAQQQMPYRACTPFLSEAGIQPPSYEDSSSQCHRKHSFFLWLDQNYFLNKHEQVQEVLSKKFVGRQVTQGLDMIQRLHEQIQQKARSWQATKCPGRILWSRNQKKKNIKQAGDHH